MTPVLMLFTVQCVMGAYDNLWHHELEADLTHEPTARTELVLHCAREFLYAILLLTLGWLQPEGAWAAGVCLLLAAEVVITINDFLVEDRTRKLPPQERVLHTLLALTFGAAMATWSPILFEACQQPTDLVHVDQGAWSWLMTLFAFGAGAWGVSNLLAVARLGVPEWKRHPVRARPSEKPRTILVTGGTGFIGRAVVRRFMEQGDRVIVLSRKPARAADRFGPLVEVIASLESLDVERRIDAIVNLAGEPLVSGPWTSRRRQRFFVSRVGTTGDVTALIQRLRHKPRVLVSGSAIGFYGNRADEVLDESHGAGRGLLAELCQAWEQAASAAAAYGVRVCCLRIGLVLGPGGGVLAPLALATRLGGGMVFGSGEQWQSWIHRDDLVRMIEFLIERDDLHGAFNAVAPAAVTQRRFAHALGDCLRRPVLFRAPEILLRRLMGEMADVFLISQLVMPSRASVAGFRFDHARLPDAFSNVLNPATRVRVLTVHANFECPVCRMEMLAYARAAERTRCDMEIRPIQPASHTLAASGLTVADLEERLYVELADGSLRSGMEAFIAVWNSLPGYRRRAWWASRPVLRAICAFFYDLVAAPLLTWWSRGRRAARPLRRVL